MCPIIKKITIITIIISLNTYCFSNNIITFNQLNCSTTLANILCKFFNTPYKHDLIVNPKFAHKNNITKIIKGKKYTVFRKNHGLAHGIRQGFLAVDIVSSISKFPHKIFSKKVQKLNNWIKKKLKTDEYFIQKIEFAVCFQRTGRQSEVSSSSYPYLYNSYERSDAKNFYEAAKKYVGPNNLFKSLEELNIYKEAILWSTKNEGQIKNNKDLKYIRKILHTAHLLDLRRIDSFSIARIKSDISKTLFGEKIQSFQINYKTEYSIIEFLWKRSGIYLKITGDRDVATSKKYFSNRFFILSNNPNLLVKTLYKKTRINI